MQNTHRSTRIFGRAALVALLAAPAVGAQGRWEGEGRDQRDVGISRRDNERRLFSWRGTVNGEARIYMRGSRVQTGIASSADTRSRNREYVDVDNALPRREGVVRVQLLEGRGRVFVVQQPNAGNDYTTVVRVMDAQRGADRYRFVAYFEPSDTWGGRRRDDGTVWGSPAGDVRNSVLRWTGNVDGEIRIALWRGQVSYDVRSGQQPQNVRSTLGNQMQRQNGYLSVSLRQGRGSVSVIEQPSASNNYTAVVRVVDSQGGYGYYDFDLISDGY